MASRIEFVEFIADQLKDAGDITYRKMFGEYGIYCNGKIFGVICEDMLYIKITDAGRKICPDLEEAPPYEGAKNYFLMEDVENKETLTNLVAASCRELPEPKPKKRKIKLTIFELSLLKNMADYRKKKIPIATDKKTNKQTNKTPCVVC